MLLCSVQNRDSLLKNKIYIHKMYIHDMYLLASGLKTILFPLLGSTLNTVHIIRAANNFSFLKRKYVRPSLHFGGTKQRRGQTFF